MSGVYPPVPTPPRGRYPLAIATGAAVLLLAEVVAVTVRFDTASLASEHVWWADLIGEANFLPQLLATAAAAVAAFAGDRVRREFAAAGGLAHQVRLSWPALVAHLVAYAVFVLLTFGLLEGSLRSSPRAGLWAVGWFVAGCLSASLLAAAVLPGRTWLALARRVWLPAGLAAAAGLVVWGLGHWAGSLWDDFGAGTLWAVEHTLRLVYPDVVCYPARQEVGTSAYYVRLGPACSGYEGIGLVLAFLGCYLWLCRDTLRFPAVLVLIPVGLATAWVGNVLRIDALIAIGTAGWPGVARGGFHSQAGWLAFIGIALGLIVLSRWVPAFSRSAGPPVRAGRNPVAPFLVPIVALVGTGMLTGALAEDGFDPFYPARAVATAAALWYYRRDYAALGWSVSPVAVGVGLLVFAAWVLPESFTAGGTATDLPGRLGRMSPGGRAAWLAARVFGAVVAVPLAEELAFRGFLLARLRGESPGRPTGRWVWAAVLVSSVLFGALHPGRWVVGTAAGLAFAWVYYRRGRLADAVVSHAVANAALAVYVPVTGAWDLW